MQLLFWIIDIIEHLVPMELLGHVGWGRRLSTRWPNGKKHALLWCVGWSGRRASDGLLSCRPQRS